MSAAKHKTSVVLLAREAEKMPWEDRAPLFARMAFQEAITPELFIQLFDAMDRLHGWAQAQNPDTHFGGDHPIAMAREAIAIARATGTA